MIYIICITYKRLRKVNDCETTTKTMFVYANTTDVILNIYSNFVDNIGTLFNLFYIAKCDKIVLLLLNAIFT